MAPPLALPADTLSSMTSPPPSSLVGSQEERLIAILSSPSNFSVASYLNLALGDVDASPEDMSQRMAELALQLQLQTQGCHEDIGRIGAELQAIVPRCAADVSRIGVGLEGLLHDASALLEATSVDSEQDNVSSSLETLSTLHALQANLTRTKEILTAAATWDATLNSIAPLLAQQNLTEAVSALALLESGEKALRGMPHPEERTAAISKIRQQVSVLLQPQLKHALANMATRLAPLQQCVALYSKLGTIDILKEEYIKNRPAAIHKMWFDYKPLINTDEAPASFFNWLPSWFDAVLSLVTEERRQSMSIFGSGLVPEITVKILRECFRPLISSFRSRLEAVYSSSVTGPSKGSWETLCAIYESTLQFLSLAYEAIAGGWLDMAETGLVTVNPGDNLTLFNSLLDVFAFIATPFAPYQECFAQLETKFSSALLQGIAKEIRAVTVPDPNIAVSVEGLQAATVALKRLTLGAFPIFEGGLARFELVKGGHGVFQALGAIDKLLAEHANEVALGVHSLLGFLGSSSEALADTFDDSYVSGALEVLHVAGTFRRELGLFGNEARERFRVIADRLSAQAVRESEISEAVSSRRTAKDAFALPESLSAVEVDSFITQSVCASLGGEDGPGSAAVLQRLASKERETVLFSEAEAGVDRLIHSCHSFVFDVCSAVPMRHLEGMAAFNAWKKETGFQSLETYGTLPQQYITHVGEHMLALVQALEPFAADSESLALANEVMKGLRTVALPSWRDLITATGTAESGGVIEALMEGKGLDELAGVPEVDEDERSEDSEGAIGSADFCNAWLDVVGLAVTGRLLEQIMRIPLLTTKGCEHLNSDLNYLMNVLSALGVAGHPHPLIRLVSELTTLDGDSLSERIEANERRTPLTASLRSIEERLAAIRGVAARFNY